MPELKACEEVAAGAGAGEGVAVDAGAGAGVDGAPNSDVVREGAGIDAEGGVFSLRRRGIKVGAVARIVVLNCLYDWRHFCTSSSLP